MSHAILLQHGSDTCLQLLQATSGRHHSACKRHGIEYFCYSKKINPEPFSHNSEGQIAFYQALMGSHPLLYTREGDILMFLDADAVWVDTSVNLSTAIDDECDMAIVGKKKTEYNPTWVNGGFMAVRVNRATREFWKTVVCAGPVRENNKCLDLQLCNQIDLLNPRMKFLPDEYNWFKEYNHCPSTPKEKAIVLHFPYVEKHKALERIKEVLNG